MPQNTNELDTSLTDKEDLQLLGACLMDRTRLMAVLQGE